MQTRTLSVSTLLAAAGSVMLLGGCPQKKAVEVRLDHAQGQRVASPGRMVSEENYADMTQINVRPEGGEWVYIQHPVYYSGQHASVEYRLEKLPGGRSWMVLVPVSADGSDVVIDPNTGLALTPGQRQNSQSPTDAERAAHEAGRDESDSGIQNGEDEQPAAGRMDDGAAGDAAAGADNADGMPVAYDDTVRTEYPLSSAEDSAEIPLSTPGTYVVRVYSDDGSGRQLVTQSELFTVRGWPRGDRLSSRRPYLSLGGEGVNSGGFNVGDTVSTHFSLPDSYPEGSWIGVVPLNSDVAAVPGGTAADVSAVPQVDVSQQREGDFSWTADQPGTYVFRLYPIAGSQVYYTAESEPFTVGQGTLNVGGNVGNSSSADAAGSGGDSGQ